MLSPSSLFKLGSEISTNLVEVRKLITALRGDIQGGLGDLLAQARLFTERLEEMQREMAAMNEKLDQVVGGMNEAMARADGALELARTTLDEGLKTRR